ADRVRQGRGASQAQVAGTLLDTRTHELVRSDLRARSAQARSCVAAPDLPRHLGSFRLSGTLPDSAEPFLGLRAHPRMAALGCCDAGPQSWWSSLSASWLGAGRFHGDGGDLLYPGASRRVGRQISRARTRALV